MSEAVKLLQMGMSYREVAALYECKLSDFMKYLNDYLSTDEKLSD